MILIVGRGADETDILTLLRITTTFWGEGMPDIIYCNSFEVSHNKEAFCMIFKFQKPDGSEISIYVVTSPQGCKTFLNVTTAEMTEYESQYGKVEPWASPKNTGTPNSTKNHTPIYT